MENGWGINIVNSEAAQQRLEERDPLSVEFLRDIMKPIPAHLYLAYVRTMETLLMGYPVKFDLEKARKVFDGCLEMCEELGLMASTASAQKIVRLLSEEKPKLDKLHDLIGELQERVVDEMSMPRFFAVAAEEAAYYNNPTKGWSEVIKRFPSANTDIEEMGKCFALSRYAGAVFHSVQTIECGLIELGKFLEVSDPKSGWTSVSGKLATLVKKTKYPDLLPCFQKNFSFLEQMHATVGALNNAWRNKISHAQGRLGLMTSEFSPDVAEEIMVVSRSFMRRLATEMPDVEKIH